MQPEITTFSPEKLAEVQTFLRVALRDDAYVMDFETRDVDLKDITLHYQNNGGQFWLLVAGSDQIVAGCIALERVNKDTLELKRFVVHQLMRDHGFGERMLLTALRFAEDSDCNRVRVYVESKQQAALQLLRKHRFHEIKRFNTNPHAEYFLEHRIQEKAVRPK